MRRGRQFTRRGCPSCPPVAIVLVEVAIFRWPLSFVRGNIVATFLVTALLVVPLILWDVIRHRRLHSVTLCGSLGFLIYGIVRLPIVGSGTWHALGRALAIVPG